MFTIFINNIEFYAYHGATPAEQEIGHRYVMTLSLLIDGKASATDSLKDTVDYGAVSELAVEVACAKNHRLIERVAQLVSEAILDEFTHVEEIEVTLEKLAPPMPVVCESAGVSLRLERR